MTQTKHIGRAMGVLALLTLPQLLACVCGPGAMTAFANQPIEAGTTTEFTVVMTRYDSISPELSLLLEVPGAPEGSELRMEVSPGTELVSSGPDLTLEVDDLEELLAGCNGGCEFPVRVILTEAEPGTEYRFEMMPARLYDDCGDRQVEVRLR